MPSSYWRRTIKAPMEPITLEPITLGDVRQLANALNMYLETGAY